MLPYNYTLKKSRRRKTLALKFEYDGTLVAHAPHSMKQTIIEEFIAQKSTWIARQKAKLEDKILPVLPNVENQNRIYILGKAYTLCYKKDTKSNLVIDDEKVYVYAVSFKKAHEILSAYFKALTQEWVEVFINEHKPKLKQRIHSVNYKHYKRRWGSCTHDNKLMFNIMLSALNKQSIEYVVVHELAHLKVKHHQKAFYEEGSRLLSDFVAKDRAMR